jgi:hypothetical protein
MKIAQKYSHLNGEEYLIVHHKNLYDEIVEIIASIDANQLKNKISKEKTMKGKKLERKPIQILYNIRPKINGRKHFNSL